MSNPWLSIPLKVYEGHMGSPEVQQLAVLAELFKRAFDYCLPHSVAVLGVAGGNGLEQIDGATTKRTVGVDINQGYLEEVQRRFGSGRLAGLELYCRVLTQQDLNLAPVALAHAALIFEHLGLGRALENALSLVAPGGPNWRTWAFPGPHPANSPYQHSESPRSVLPGDPQVTFRRHQGTTPRAFEVSRCEPEYLRILSSSISGPENRVVRQTAIKRSRHKRSAR